MGRPPCSDMWKKGPWTPEEDILLVSYIQENGPGNWKSVPTNTGLRRCSKSCRLRWSNYLRPGIKRGGFTDQEEKMIIQLQDLLGNKWAAIASYLPERTDNDIKNYWNTHLKKKLKRFNNSSSVSRGQWERRLQTDINTAKQALQEALSMEEETKHGFIQSSADSYACSAENIARLLKGWAKNTQNSEESNSSSSIHDSSNNSTPSIHHHHHHQQQQYLLFSSWDSSSDYSRSSSPEHGEEKPLQVSGFEDLLSMENWLLEDDQEITVFN